MNTFRHILHIVDDLEVSSRLTCMLDLLKELEEYAHYVLLPELTDNIDFDIVRILQSTGANVILSDSLSNIDNVVSTALLYNCKKRYNLPNLLKVYYAFDSGPVQSVDNIILISDYSMQLLKLPGIIVPPAIPVHKLKIYNRPQKPFTVGVISTYTNNKYPTEFVNHVANLRVLPFNILITTPDKGTIVNKKAIYMADVKYTAGIHYLTRCNLLIHWPDGQYLEREVYSKTIIESLALGRPVIVSAQSNLPAVIPGLIVCKTYNEALEIATELKNDNELYRNAVVTAQKNAAQFDIGIYRDEFRKVLNA